MFACLHAPGNVQLLLECAASFSPLIEETSADTVVFDIRGLRLIYGTPQQIAQEILRLVSIPANLAIASNPDAAVHAARGFKETTIILPGKEEAALAPLPLYLLGGSPKVVATLHLWGLRTFGDLAGLPSLGVAARLGDEGMELQRLACGQGNRLLRVSGAGLLFQEEMEPESVLELMESLLLLVGRMLNDLCRRLTSHSLAAHEIRLRLKLEKAPEHKVILQLPVPMLDAKVFLKLLQLELDEKPPQAAIEKIFLELIPVEPRTTQHDLFIPAIPEPEKLEITLKRIRALVGAGNVGAAELIDTHRPDRFKLSPLYVGKPMHGSPPARFQLALRRLRPPVPAQVWCTGSNEPVRIFSSKVEGRVVACAGPWHTSGDWWAGEPWDRKDWDVELLSGPLLRIFWDLRGGHWFVDGSYD